MKLPDNKIAKKCPHYNESKCENDYYCPEGAYCHKTNIISGWNTRTVK